MRVVPGAGLEPARLFRARGGLSFLITIQLVLLNAPDPFVSMLVAVQIPSRGHESVHFARVLCTIRAQNTPRGDQALGPGEQQLPSDNLASQTGSAGSATEIIATVPLRRKIAAVTSGSSARSECCSTRPSRKVTSTRAGRSPYWTTTGV